MAIEEGLAELIRQQSGIMALLSSSVGKNVVIDKIDQVELQPYISITQLSTNPHHMLERNEGVRTATIDLDCVATAKPKANEIADALEAFLVNYSGPAGNHTIHEVHLNDRSGDAWALAQGTDNYKFVTTVNADFVFS